MLLDIASHNDKPTGRIRQKNEQLIISAAEVEFAQHGFKGATMNNIAQRAGLPKANIHYYFNNKLELYAAVLGNIIELWDSTLNRMNPDDDPGEALTLYIANKIEFSRQYPQASRVFAMEMVAGAPHLNEYFNDVYRNWFHSRTEVFRAWTAQGKMDPIEPAHLIFMLWSATQQYADFAAQIAAALGRDELREEDFQAATRTLTHIVLKGCGVQLASEPLLRKRPR